MACSNCCELCIAGPRSTLSDTKPPFASFTKLLPAGVVTFTVLGDLQRACDHFHAEDGWHTFRGSIMKGHVNATDAPFCQEIDFLVSHHFVAATYSVCNQELFVRIYVIPYDLCNSQGKLRVRADSIMGPARRYMIRLLPRITQDPGAWRGQSISLSAPLLMPHIKDLRTLAEIYGDLASPTVCETPAGNKFISRLLNFQDDLSGLGMRTTLYKYQRRSVAAMMQRESSVKDIPDPLFIPLATMDQRIFYLQPGTMEILQERPMIFPCCSGILCEELGTGKTVMTIALILATLNQLSVPEESILDDRLVMTPFAFKYFPSEKFLSARQRFSRRSLDRDLDNRPYVPSLVELLLHRSKTSPDASIPFDEERFARRVELEDKISLVPGGTIRQHIVPFYHHYVGEPTNHERMQRLKRNDIGPKRMYLSSATLVVVPPNLLSQWDRELLKHCEYPLRLLLLRTGTPTPSVRVLASDYDIILMSYNRFTFEANNSDTTKLHSWTPCSCPAFPGTRIPDCNCQIPNVSPFLQIRWKRLVVDEGHVSAMVSTVLSYFVKLLSVEFRWIVTGTPTTNLLGLSLGQKGSDATQKVEDEISISRPTSPPVIEYSTFRSWTQYDRMDLQKLGNMMTHFIAVPRFTANAKLFQSSVTEPLLDPSGPRLGSIQVLNQVMKMVMIRHRIEDIEEDIVLPPITHESVLLDLDPYVIKSYNAMQAAIAINAVDSERQDQDYMFHPKNTNSLQLTIKNMSQLMFWSIDENMFNADQSLEDAQTVINRALERKASTEDLELLQNAYNHLQLAAEDPMWRAIQTFEDVPYRCYNLKPRIMSAWSRIPGQDSNQTNKQSQSSHFIHADRLRKLRTVILAHPLADNDNIIMRGFIVSKKDQMQRQQYEESLLKKTKSRGHKTTRNDEINTASSFLIDNASKKAIAQDTLREMQDDLGRSLARLDSEECPGNSTHRDYSNNNTRPSSLVALSPLANVRIGSSASSKINFIIAEVLKYSPTEKILIFSESELSLAHVAEALELVHVKSLRFSTQISPRIREQLVLTFETSETFRVFLMELKHGARGLNLVSASRVIFCEPVWQADVESQAIKRVHRIGQTRPIIVKTLAIRGTAEENMVERKNVLKGHQDKLPKWIEEAGMRHFIANPKFIEDPPSLIHLDFPLIDLPPDVSPADSANPAIKLTITLPARPQTRSPRKSVRVEDRILSPPLDPESPPAKKKKVVKFA